jgi:hypothetical protein
MQYQKGKIVAEPKADDKNILLLQKPDVGGTEVNFLCGNCNTMLVKGFDPAKYKNSVIKCMNCGKFNAV